MKVEGIAGGTNAQFGIEVGCEIFHIGGFDFAEAVGDKVWYGDASIVVGHGGG